MKIRKSQIKQLITEVKNEIDYEKIINDLGSSQIDAIFDFYSNKKSTKGNFTELSKWMYGKEGKKAIEAIKQNPEKFRNTLRKFYTT